MGGITERILLLFKHIFLGLARLLKKIICISRKRKQVDDSDPTSVVVITGPTAFVQEEISSSAPDGHPGNYGNTHDNNTIQMQEWENWNAGFENPDVQINSTPPPPNGQIEQEIDQAGDMDFFKDMEPKVKVKKVFIKRKTEVQTTSNRLAMDDDLEFKVSGELDTWKDDEGWDGDDSDDLDIDEAQVRREAQEQRRVERQSRNKQKKIDKSLRPHEKLASKVS